MSGFKQWYEAKYGIPYPGQQHELTDTVLARTADAVAAYIDEKLAQHPSSNAQVAAPDMLEALKHIARVLDKESYPENGSLESTLGKLARKAIAKAELKEWCK